MEVELKVKDSCEIMGFCSTFALSLVEMGPNGHIFSPQIRDVSVSTLNKTYSHTDTQSPHNGLWNTNHFQQTVQPAEPGDFKASIIRSPTENLKFSFSSLTVY